MKTILITGGSGLIGKTLQKKLIDKGYIVTILSRKKTNNINQFYWNIDDGVIEKNAIKQADYIIHLAGAGIADKRWTKKRKLELISSRVNSTKLLYQKVKEFKPELKGFIAASGVGIYGATTTNKTFTETEKPANDFLATICKLWEKESLTFNKQNIRTVILRTGVVFSKKDGAFEKIVNPIKNGFGAVLGKGNQFTPWIHINDLCEMYIQAIENNKMEGCYNAVASENTTNKKLTFKIADFLKKNIWLPHIPSFILKIFFGKMAVLLLKGSKVSNEKIKKTGFNFKYNKLDDALKNLLS